MPKQKKDVCHISVEFPNMTKKNKTHTEEARYNAPSGWMITSSKPIITHDIGPTTYKVDMVAANSSYVTSSTLNNSYKDAMNIVADLDFKGAKLAALKAKIDSSFSEFQSYQSQVTASHQTLVLKTTIRGQGAFNGRTILDMYLHIEIEEIPSQIRSESALNSHFKSIIDNFVASNPTSTNDPDPTPDPEPQLAPQSLVESLFLQESYFTINKYEQLVRIYWSGNWKTEVIASSIPVIIGSLRRSEKFKTIYALTDKNDILVVQNINGNWGYGVIDAWGGNIILSSFKPLDNAVGIHGINEGGNFVITWKSTDGGTIPDGTRHSFAVVGQAKNLV